MGAKFFTDREGTYKHGKREGMKESEIFWKGSGRHEQ